MFLDFIWQSSHVKSPISITHRQARAIHQVKPEKSPSDLAPKERWRTAGFYGDFVVDLWWFCGGFMVILWWFECEMWVIWWWFYGDLMVKCGWFRGDFHWMYGEFCFFFFRKSDWRYWTMIYGLGFLLGDVMGIESWLTGEFWYILVRCHHRIPKDIFFRMLVVMGPCVVVWHRPKDPRLPETLLKYTSMIFNGLT